MKRKSKKRRNKKRKFITLLAGLILAGIVGIIVVIVSISLKAKPSDTHKIIEYSESKNINDDGILSVGDANEQDVQLLSSVRIGSTGDILIHPSVLSAFNMGDYYDFSEAFSYVAPYYRDVDYMVANLEVTLVDPQDGYEYSSNPFLSPDAVAYALKEAGVDMCLTANNHSYDSGGYGLRRTQNILNSLELDHVGTKSNENDSFVFVKEVNGIKIGFVCYTYETGAGAYYSKSLNYNPLTDEDSVLVNTFNYKALDTLYKEVKGQIEEMEKRGCDVNIYYMHWGDEYLDYPNELQIEIAEQLCELGVDIIIGGHPHVVQKYQKLISENGHQTLCLYSMGNELSNQRREYMNEDDYRGYTEDGLIFIVNISKYSDGSIEILPPDVIPTWVEKSETFRIIPLDPNVNSSEWMAESKEMAIESFNRTMERLEEFR